MNRFFFLVFLFFAIGGEAQKPADKRLAGLDTFVNKVLRDWRAPGVSIAVVEKNKVVYAGGFGYRDLEKKLPVTAHTLFAIGSCTKAFTASILGMLEKEGTVELDKPVRNFFPELRFYNDELNANVTLRDMMSHRTGLPRHDFSWYGSSAKRDELIKRIEFLEPSAKLREVYQYNNFMYLAQGVLIEKLTGKTWEENMSERILRPLGMNTSNLSVSEMEEATDRYPAFAVSKDSILYYIPYRNTDAVGPAGSMNSTANDMAKWLITWINGGKHEGKEIIPASFLYQAIVPQMATGGGLPAAPNPDIHLSGYGFAWGMSSYRGHYRVEHGGGIDGFISTTCFFPSDSIGIFVVSNQSGAATSIRNFIADRMLNLPYRNWHKYLFDLERASAAAPSQRSDSLNRKFNTKPSHALGEYAGTYRSQGYGDVRILLKNDTLFGQFNDFSLRLDHFHYDQFNAVALGDMYEGGEPFRFNFHTDVRGNIEKILAPMEVGVEEIEFLRQTDTISVAKTLLEKYEGEYELEGLVVTVYIKNNVLWVLVPGQPDYELVATKPQEFNIKIAAGYSVKFELNEKGESTAIVFIQPNGTFKAPRKK